MDKRKRINQEIYFFPNNLDKIIKNNNNDVYDTKCKVPKSQPSSAINAKAFLSNSSPS